MEPDLNRLSVKIAALEERMNTKQAEYKTDIATLDASIAKRDANLSRNLLAFVGFVVSLIILGFVVLGFLIRL